MNTAPHAAIRILTGLLSAALLAGCVTPTPAPPGGVEAREPSGFPDARYYQLPQGSVFRINTSALTVRVYRAGRLKQFGHDHVITSTALQGLIHVPQLEANVGAAFADLYLPVVSLVVDGPEDRDRAGPPFDSPISDANRNGTRNNLLGPLVLDAQNHPFIQIAVGPGSQTQAQLRITFKGQAYDMLVPVSWTRANGKLAGSSAFTVTHAAIGLTPFSILGGAISVAEEIQVSLRLEALLTAFSHPQS